MLEHIHHILQFYFQKMAVPQLFELPDVGSELLSPGCCFVTFFINGEVRGSAGNIKEIAPNLAQELITNTVHAISKDNRFSPVTLGESGQMKTRIDVIQQRKVISSTDPKQNLLGLIDPITRGIIVIKKDYSKSATILPNIESKILVGTDYTPYLAAKLGEEFKQDDYYIYEIETKVVAD